MSDLLEVNEWRVLEPCEDCPIEYGDKAMNLKKGRVAAIKKDLRDGESFNCHKTVYDKGYDYPRMCAGAYNYLKRLKRPNNIMQIAERLENMKKDK